MRYRLNGFGQFCVAVMLVVALMLSVCGLNGCGSHSPAPVVALQQKVHKQNFAWGEQCSQGFHVDCVTDAEGNVVSCSCVPDDPNP